MAVSGVCGNHSGSRNGAWPLSEKLTSCMPHRQQVFDLYGLCALARILLSVCGNPLKEQPVNIAKILKPAALALTLCAAAWGTANAAVVATIIDSSAQKAGNDAHLYAAGYNATQPAGTTWAPAVDPTVIYGNSSGNYQTPFNFTPLQNTQSYFSIGGGVGGEGTDTSPVSLNYAQDQTFFSILWGSIDSYNTLQFFKDGIAVIGGTFTGTDIRNLIGGLAQSAPNYEVVGLVNFTFDGRDAFDSVKFTSTQAAFEFALPSAVPEPGMLALLALGLIGVGVARRRQAS